MHVVLDTLCICKTQKILQEIGCWFAVVAVVAGIIFLGEKISWHEPVGAVVVLFGAAIAQERVRVLRR